MMNADARGSGVKTIISPGGATLYSQGWSDSGTPGTWYPIYTLAPEGRYPIAMGAVALR